MSDVREQISQKRERESLLLGSLPGTTRSLRILSYTKQQLPTHFLSEVGGLGRSS